MGFTAGMDDVEGERFSRAALSASPPPQHVRPAVPEPEEPGHGRLEGSRQELPLGTAAGPRAVRVRGLDEAERARIRQEAQLLAALEVAGVGAAPAVLELEDEEYVRESASALSRRSGRRAAGTATPPTGERRAVAHARQALDEMIDALHERGWVLGAPDGEGVGARSDGSVLVLALQGLRRDRSLSARQSDRRWVDSVLQDQDRTLRRRVHQERPREGEGRLRLGGEPAPQGSGSHAGQVSVPEDEAPSAPQQATLLPSPRGPRRDAPGRVLSAVQDVLGQPRLRRIAVLSGALVLLAGTVLVVGVRGMQGPEEPGEGGERPVAAAPARTAAGPAPQIGRPQALVAELAGSRHAYVTGMADRPASAPGSSALAEDERVRAAYDGVTVRSGGPVVHSAETVQQPDSEGTAVLHAVTSMEQLRLEEADGTATTVPATDPVPVRLVLDWDGQEWLLTDVAQLSADAVPESP